MIKEKRIKIGFFMDDFYPSINGVNLVMDNCKEICEKTIEDVDKFAKGTEQFDDITILALKYLKH